MHAFAKPSLAAILPVFLLIGLVPVAFAETGCVEDVPDIDVSPANIISGPGQTVAYTVLVENEDSDNCPIKNFTLSGTSTAGFSVSFSPSTLYIEPLESETAIMRVTVPSGAAAQQSNVSARVNGGNMSNSVSVGLEVREEVEECDVQVSSVRFKETDANEFDSDFAQDDEVSVYADISLIGNAASDVLMELFVEGSLFDSETDRFSGNSEATFKFGNKIPTKNYNDEVDVRVVATPTCNPSNTDEDEDRFDILESDEEVDIEFDVGTPGKTRLGGEVTSRIFVENKGSDNVKVNVDAWLCKERQECSVVMDCGDTTLVVEDDDVVEFVCTGTPKETGIYRVEAEVTFEDDEDFEKSNQFPVYDDFEQPEVSGASDDDFEPGKVSEIRYICEGGTRKAVFTTLSGTQKADVEYCPFGCENGNCNKPSVKTAAKQSGVSDGNVESNRTANPREPVFNRPSYDLSTFIGWLKNLLFSFQPN